jgi:hypothetical protein
MLLIEEVGDGYNQAIQVQNLTECIQILKGLCKCLKKSKTVRFLH